MKDLITTIGSMALLLVFVFQFAANQSNISKFVIADSLLESVEQSAGIGESADIPHEVKEKLSEVFHCGVEEIYVENKGEGMYMVNVPVKNIIACGELLGISDEENKAVYKKMINIRTEQ